MNLNLSYFETDDGQTIALDPTNPADWARIGHVDFAHGTAVIDGRECVAVDAPTDGGAQ